MALQEKENNKDNYHIANQEWLLEDVVPAPKQRLEQESGNTSGKGIQQEEQQGGQKQVTSIHVDFDSNLSVGTKLTSFNPPGRQEGPPPPLLLNPQSQDGTEESGHQLVSEEVSAVMMDRRVSNMEDSLNNQGKRLQVIEYLPNQGTSTPHTTARC